MREDMFRIGVITSTHGLKGEFKVFPTTDDVNRFKKLKKCIVKTPNGKEFEAEKKSCRFFKNMVILSFVGYDDINMAEGLKQSEIYVTRENAVPLSEDEFYIADVIDMEVVDEESKSLGVLEDVMQTGANDVFVVRMNDERELLVPVIKDCVIDIDYEKNRVVVRLMKGMLD